METKTAQDGQKQTPALDSAGIRQQLQRLLSDPLFSNSKRYPLLLAHSVEQTLKGNTAELKERSIGIEVFGRSPSYDSNADPVVRITAGEVRKRLTQYYYNPMHAGELVIELPIGSYVPLFHSSESETEAEAPEAAPEPVVATPAEKVAPTPIRSGGGRRWAMSLALVLAAGAAGVTVGLRYQDFRRPSAIDRFWAPITDDSNSATYCLGEPSEENLLGVGSSDSPKPTVADAQQEPLYRRLRYSRGFWVGRRGYVDPSYRGS